MSEPFRICISASFTAEPLEAILKFWGGQLAVDFEVRFAPFQQVIQTLLDPAGVFASNWHGVNVAMVRMSDFGQETLKRSREIQDALQVAAGRDACPLIFVLCPSQDGENAEEMVEKFYPVASKFDVTADRLGAIPYTEKYFAAIGTALGAANRGAFAGFRSRRLRWIATTRFGMEFAGKMGPRGSV